MIAVIFGCGLRAERCRPLWIWVRGLGRSSRRWMASSRSNDFRASLDPGKLLALPWRDEAAVDAFRNWEIHRGVQANSRRDVFLGYRLHVAAVLRDYGMTEREQALRDSREAHA